MFAGAVVTFASAAAALSAAATCFLVAAASALAELARLATVTLPFIPGCTSQKYV